MKKERKERCYLTALPAGKEHLQQVTEELQENKYFTTALGKARGPAMIVKLVKNRRAGFPYHLFTETDVDVVQADCTSGVVATARAIRQKVGADHVDLQRVHIARSTAERKIVRYARTHTAEETEAYIQTFKMADFR